MDKLSHLTDEQLWEQIDNPSLTKFADHLRACKHCTDKLEEMALLDHLILEEMEDQPSFAFTNNVVRVWENSLVRFSWFAYVLAVCFFILFGLSFYLSIQANVTFGLEVTRAFLFLVIICSFLILELYPVKKKIG
jgi:hypothetical protein